eukprot:TRINITY_DN77916_c0_g1_i1.p1 TRINITY_DN77916_c0_g1~~TRINITY_DN77916_c0_g1_i1.p1  ORF type:complete len:492 (+),score=133.30 TRINITY_DN77916_c0_g1_i1:38-1513(+)
MAAGPQLDEAAEIARRSALEAITAAQEELSVKGILELQRLEQVSASARGVVGAALCLVAGTGDDAVQTSQIPSATWGDLRELLVKPGHVVTSLRRFPQSVDSGRVPEGDVINSRRCLEVAGAFSPPAEESALVKGLQDWVQSAWGYWETARGAFFSGEPMPISGAGPLPPSPAGYAEDMAGARHFTGSTGASRMTPPTGSPARGQGQSTAPRRSSKGNGYAGGYRQVRGADTNVRATRSPVRGTPPGGNTPASSPGMRGPSFGGSSQSSRGPAPRSAMVLQAKDWKAKLEELKKETREMKALESTMKWSMARDAEKLRKMEQKEDQKDVLQMREQFSREMLELAKNNKQHTLEEELAESKDFQEFKRTTKQIAHDETLLQNRQQYLEHKDHAEWHAELKRAQHAEWQKTDVQDHLEQTNFMAEYRLEAQQREDIEQRQDRADAEYREMQLAFHKANQERQAALEALEHVRSRSKDHLLQHVHMPVLTESER